jgi:ferredoxin-NADP reductase
VRTLELDVPGWPGHRAGQHLDLRLTAEDGYEAQRSYSVASAPDAPHVEITVERLDDGEVSPYLTEVARANDIIEVRGPIGGYFVWNPDAQRPIALVGGGSGIAPLMSILRHRAASGNTTPARLLYSAPNAEELIYRRELDDLASRHGGPAVTYTLTRAQPPEWKGYRRRIDRDMLTEVLGPSSDACVLYVCGPTAMVESVANQLVALGHKPHQILTERFGPTGGS